MTDTEQLDYDLFVLKGKRQSYTAIAETAADIKEKILNDIAALDEMIAALEKKL